MLERKDGDSVGIGTDGATDGLFSEGNNAVVGVVVGVAKDEGRGADVGCSAVGCPRSRGSITTHSNVGNALTSRCRRETALKATVERLKLKIKTIP